MLGPAGWSHEVNERRSLVDRREDWASKRPQSAYGNKLGQIVSVVKKPQVRRSVEFGQDKKEAL